MNIKHQLVGALMGLTLLGAGLAHAATITFDALSSSVAVGQNVVVKVVGRDFTDGDDGTYGGGLTISWDPTKLALVSYDTSVFAGDQLLATANTNTVVDNAAGQLRDLSVSSFFDGVYTPDFDIALLTFTGVATGSTALTPSIGYFTSGFPNIWTDTSNTNPIELNLNYATGNVSVSAVPVPAAVWLLGSAVAGFFALTRRKLS